MVRKTARPRVDIETHNKGTLISQGYHLNMSLGQRKKILTKIARKQGYEITSRKLNSLCSYNKNNFSGKKVCADKKWLDKQRKTFAVMGVRKQKPKRRSTKRRKRKEKKRSRRKSRRKKRKTKKKRSRRKSRRKRRKTKKKRNARKPRKYRRK